MRQIGMGVVGWGFMGKTHTHALREMGLFYSEADFRPVLECVCTRRLEVARQAAQDAGFAHYTDDFDQLLAMPQVEAVSICTPNALHLPMALKALEAGKHVYIDKPLAMSLEEALRIQQAVERTGLTLQVAHNNRFFPAMLRARQLVEQGRVGRVLSFRCDYLHSGSVDASRPAGWKMSSQGGVLLDLASHAADLILWLAGPVKEVCCRTRLLYAQRPASGGGQTTRPGGGPGAGPDALGERRPGHCWRPARSPRAPTTSSPLSCTATRAPCAGAPWRPITCTSSTTPAPRPPWAGSGASSACPVAPGTPGLAGNFCR